MRGERNQVRSDKERCGVKRPSRGVSADELPARYALRQCKRMYGLCWRNRHWSAPARSRMGRHVKSGSCNMPLRSARVSTGCGGGVELRACGREAHSLPAVGGRGAFETAEGMDPAGGRRARDCGEQQLVRAVLGARRTRCLTAGGVRWCYKQREATDGWCMEIPCNASSAGNERWCRLKAR